MDGDYGFGPGNLITVGPDGNIWFVEGAVSKIGMITPDGVISEYPVPAGQDPHAIVAGPDGNLWFTDFSTAEIGVMSTAGKLLDEYAVPQPEETRHANELGGITVGSDQHLFFAMAEGFIGGITTSGSVSEISNPKHATHKQW